MKAVYDNEIKLTKACNAMKVRGIKLNYDYTVKAMEYDLGELQKEKENFEKVTGRTFKDSPKLFREVFDEAGETYPRTEKGNPSFKREALEEINTPTATCINKIRKIEKKISSFYTTFLYLADSNNIIHASANSGGTVTGRFSYKEPNLQQLSKEDKENDAGKPFYIRGCFEPRPDHFYCAIDYQAQEYRLLVDYAGEKGVIDAVMAGEDVHQTVADMLGVSRKIAKNCSFAQLYGAGIQKLADMIGCSYEEAKHLRSLYMARLPKVKKFIQDVMYVAENRGYIKNRYGRVLRFQRGEEYKAVNHLIQGTAADTLKFSLAKIYEQNKLDYFPVTCLIHDEIVLELKEEHTGVIDSVRDIMSKTYESFDKDLILETSAEVSRKSMSVWDMQEYV